MPEGTPTSTPSQSGANGGRNGNGVIGRALAVLATLPPAFLALLVLNFAFIGVMGWVLDAHSERRAELLERIIETCMKK